MSKNSVAALGRLSADLCPHVARRAGVYARRRMHLVATPAFVGDPVQLIAWRSYASLASATAAVPLLRPDHVNVSSRANTTVPASQTANPKTEQVNHNNKNNNNNNNNDNNNVNNDKSANDINATMSKSLSTVSPRAEEDSTAIENNTQQQHKQQQQQQQEQQQQQQQNVESSEDTSDNTSGTETSVKQSKKGK